MKRIATAAATGAAAALLAASLSGCSGSTSASASGSSSSGGSSGGGSTSSSSSPSSSPSSSSDSLSGSSSNAAQATVGTRAAGKLGTILVDGKGKTLYLFAADKSTKSTCTGACAQAWPPLLTTGSAKAGKGAKKSLLGTTNRSGGKKEVTYNGHPLYYYAGDSKAGQTNGQGLNQFGALWYVLNPAGKQVTK
jgi:predicted lipoprotein with Yx(FWY)xxD motif